ADLAGPAGHVAEVRRGARHVDHTGHALGLAHVDRLELGEFVCMRFDQVGDLVHDLFALDRRKVAPAAVIERGTGGSHGAIDVLVGRLDELRDDLARRGILDVDRLAARAVDPLAVDVELRLAVERLFHGGGIFALRAVDGGHLVHVRVLSRANLFPRFYQRGLRLAINRIPNGRYDSCRILAAPMGYA